MYISISLLNPIHIVFLSIQAAPPPPGTSPPPGPSPPPPSPSSCGDRPTSNARIVGGQESVKNSIPWQAMLRTDAAQFCGGSLISKQWVLTAAHCVEGSSAGSFKIWYSLSFVAATLHALIWSSHCVKPSKEKGSGKVRFNEHDSNIPI